MNSRGGVSGSSLSRRVLHLALLSVTNVVLTYTLNFIGRIHRLAAEPCKLCADLRQRYEGSGRIFASAIEALASPAPDAFAGEYARLKGSAEQARLYAEAARMDWEKHTRMHDPVAEVRPAS